MVGRIYLVVNTLTGKAYVGQTRGKESYRWRKHLVSARTGSEMPLHRAIRKYGRGAFTITTLEVLPIEDLDRRERFWIEKLGTLEKGYNCTSGGTSGYRFTEDVKASISKTQKLKSSEPRVRKRLSEQAIKQWEDPDFAAHMSANARRQWLDPSHREFHSKKQREFFAKHPEKKNQLRDYNRSLEGREAKSRSRKQYFKDHPEVRVRLSKSRQQATCIFGEPKAQLILAELSSGPKLSRDLISPDLPIEKVTEGLSRYQKVGLVLSRPLVSGERPDVIGRARSRTRVWELCS